MPAPFIVETPAGETHGIRAEAGEVLRDGMTVTLLDKRVWGDGST
ncbi:MAG: hypothetical protein ABEH86_04935 [Haloarcula sp.]